MKINICEINFTINQATDSKKHQNILASVALTFKGELGESFTVSGFTLWKSKFGGYNLTVPQKPGFKYCLIEKTFKQRIEQEIVKQYEYNNIPIIEESTDK